MASQVDGMEARIVSLQSKMRQELDRIHSTVQQLNPKEIVVGMAKLTHLESIVSALDEGIRKIKHLLIMTGKTPTSSSAPLNESSPRDGTWVSKGNPTMPLHNTWATKHLPCHLELPTFDNDDPDRWIYRAKRYFEINGLRSEERL